jgi:quercetin dioxygenase-like cupin family protein
MPRSVFVALALVLVSRTSAAQSPSAGAVPVYREPHHRAVYENAMVRVMDVRVEPGDSTLYHVHANRHTTVVILASREWEQLLGDARVTASEDSVGGLHDNASATLPYTHRVGNAGTTPFRYIVAQVLSPSGIDAPALPSSTGVRREMETSYARIYRVRLAPGESTASHRHAAPGLTVQVGRGTVRLEGTQADASSRASGPGAWWWRTAGSDHAIRNTGATTVDLVEIDWK